jgi:cyclase
MFRPRIIPVLLIKDGYLIKSKAFKDYTYIGDPINAVRIFNELKADELVFLDITATKDNRIISPTLIKDIAEESNMPFNAGGGIKDISHIKTFLSSGAEKVIIGSYATVNPHFIKKASDEFGSSTITVCIDIKKAIFGKEQVWHVNGTKRTGLDPLAFAQLMEKNGAGELIVQSITHDGMMKGYNLELIKKIADNVSIPVIALGGAGCMGDMKKAYAEANATGLAAGSLFVYQGASKGVLINYPEKGTFEL